MPILIADNHLDTAEALALTLESEGFDTVPVSCGADAVSAIEKHRPEAAILDLNLSDIDGFNLARHFRQSLDLPVMTATLIAYTGRQTEIERAHAADCGFDYYLLKSCSADHIGKCLGLASATGARYFKVPQIDVAKIAALSDRSNRAVIRTKNIQVMYRHLFRFLDGRYDA